jgi:hypothetical protein
MADNERGASPRRIAWRDRHTVTRIHYEDGGGDLCDVVYREPEGLKITGDGSLQAPLTVEIAPHLALVRKGDAFASIRAIFATYPGWRGHSDDYDPNALLDVIAAAVGVPMTQPEGDPAAEAEAAGYQVLKVRSAPDRWAFNRPNGNGCATGYHSEAGAWEAAIADHRKSKGGESR